MRLKRSGHRRRCLDCAGRRADQSASARWHGGPGHLLAVCARSSSGDRSGNRRHGSISGITGTSSMRPQRPIIRPRPSIIRPRGLLSAAGLLRAATGLLRSLIGTHQRKVTVAPLDLVRVLRYSWCHSRRRRRRASSRSARRPSFARAGCAARGPHSGCRSRFVPDQRLRRHQHRGCRATRRGFPSERSTTVSPTRRRCSTRSCVG